MFLNFEHNVPIYPQTIYKWLNRAMINPIRSLTTPFISHFAGDPNWTLSTKLGFD